MDISTLDWFSKLLTRHPQAPDVTRALGTSLVNALKSKHLCKQVNRAFDMHRAAVSDSLTFLKSISGQVSSKSCSLTTNAWKRSMTALQSIYDGGMPSVSWGLQRRKGRHSGFSETLEAVALANYIQRNPEIHYSKTESIDVASHTIGVNSRDIWDYSGIEPINEASEDAMAAFAIAKNNRSQTADRYFDTDVLFDGISISGPPE